MSQQQNLDPASRKDDTSPPYGGLLPYGPFPVGFERRWYFDYSRSYAPRAVQAGVPSPPKRFRPILLASWYPAVPGESAIRTYGDYLAPGQAEVGTPFEEFAGRLFDYCADKISEFGLGKARSALNAEEKATLDNIMGLPTGIGGCSPLPGPFPLVLYHPGLGGSYLDDVILCESLASRGYVVISSAFSPADVGRLSLNGDYERSNRDIAFLIERAAEQPNVDKEHIGLMGHSYGGHAVTVYQSERASIVDAVVSLDSTMELRPQNEPPWFEPAKTRLSRAENISVPMLLVAGRGIAVRRVEDTLQERLAATFAPRFDVYEGLVHAQRWYATVAHLWHCEFASSCVLWNSIRKPLWQNMPDRETVISTYHLVAETICRFLDASLKSDMAAFDWLQSRLSSETPTGYDKLDSPPLVLQFREAVPLPDTKQ